MVLHPANLYISLDCNPYKSLTKPPSKRILTYGSSSSMAGSGGLSEWSEGASVWFQPPGAAAPLPGELVEVHRAARVLLVSAHLNGQVSPPPQFDKNSLSFGIRRSWGKITSTSMILQLLDTIIQ